MRKALALWLTGALLLAAAGTGQAGTPLGPGVAFAETASAARSDAAEPLVPLVLVHGLGGSGDAYSGPLDTGLANRLVRAGYIEGRTLFRFDYQEHNNGDYVHVAVAHLGPFLASVRARTGAAQLNLLGYSMGGLVVRYLLNQPGEAEGVRTAVLLASPARGSFAADIVKDAITTQAYLQERAGGNTGATAKDQQGYVFAIARQFFEPLLTTFLVQSRFARKAPPLTDFVTWWDRTRPAEVAAWFTDAQSPWAPGAALTAAYLHALALDSARGYVQESLRAGAVRASLSPSQQGRLVEQAAEWLGIDPRGVAIDRLLAETFYLGQRGPAYLGNSFLRDWNTADTSRRGAGATGAGVLAEPAAAGPRYVIIAGTMANLYSLWWPMVTANDGAVEAASAWLPLNPRDTFWLFEGTALTASHPALKLNGQVFDRIVAELTPAPRPARRLSPLIRRWWWRDLEWEEDGQLTLRRWAPTYLELDASRLKGRVGSLTIEVESAPRLGEEPVVWAETAAADGKADTRQIQLTRVNGRWRGSLTLAEFGADPKHIRVGARLNGRVEALPANDSAPLHYRVRLNPLPAETAPQSAAPEQAPTPAPAVAASDQAPTPAPTGAAPAPATTVPGDGPDTIWVRRWTRQTTADEPAEEGHAYWVWDFGDGTTTRDDDPQHLAGEIEHSFPSSGPNRVTASSYSNLGNLLRQQTWDVGAGVQRFTFETVRPPWLRLELEGPEKWVTGRPATYRVRTESVPVPWVERQSITVDPAREFQVAWERPGTYVVRAAVKVTTTYRLPEGGRVTLRNTYIVSRRVRVYTPTLTGG